MAAATGTHSATSVPARGRPAICEPYIHPMPSPATAIAAQVRSAMWWPMKTLANSAVSSGPTAIVTSTLATGMSTSATMNAVNITLQHTPEIHSARPLWRMEANTALPCSAGRMTSSDSSVKKLRQKVTSKLAACSRWRVTTPAMDHMRVTATISATARECVNFNRGSRIQTAKRPLRRSGPFLNVL
ncbi:hypothetical protein D3C71_1434180 [compost metagenome]